MESRRCNRRARNHLVTGSFVSCTATHKTFIFLRKMLRQEMVVISLRRRCSIPQPSRTILGT